VSFWTSFARPEELLPDVIALHVGMTPSCSIRSSARSQPERRARSTYPKDHRHNTDERTSASRQCRSWLEWRGCSLDRREACAAVNLQPAGRVTPVWTLPRVMDVSSPHYVRRIAEEGAEIVDRWVAGTDAGVPGLRCVPEEHACRIYP
jgi:hypothetical protein